VEGGVSFPLTDDLAVTASYRYVHFFGAGEDTAHIVKAGIRYSF
jgi:opacity protein-like surface antigen